jgi:hypothetical protein
MRAAALTGLLLAGWFSAVVAQELAAQIRGPAPSLLFTASTVDSTRVPPPTQWKEGLLALPRKHHRRSSARCRDWRNHRRSNA